MTQVDAVKRRMLAIQIGKVKHRMFTDAEVQAVQPLLPLSVLRTRLEQTDFDIERMRSEVETATYQVFENTKRLRPVDASTGEIQKLDEITWPDGTVMQWPAMARGRQA